MIDIDIEQAVELQSLLSISYFKLGAVFALRQILRLPANRNLVLVYERGR